MIFSAYSLEIVSSKPITPAYQPFIQLNQIVIDSIHCLTTKSRRPVFFFIFFAVFLGRWARHLHTTSEKWMGLCVFFVPVDECILNGMSFGIVAVVCQLGLYVHLTHCQFGIPFKASDRSNRRRANGIGH